MLKHRLRVRRYCHEAVAQKAECSLTVRLVRHVRQWRGVKKLGVGKDLFRKLIGPFTVTKILLGKPDVTAIPKECVFAFAVSRVFGECPEIIDEHMIPL